MPYKPRRGAPRKQEADRTRNLGSITVTNLKYGLLEDMADAYDMTLTALVNQFIDEGFERHKPADRYDEIIKENEARLEKSKNDKIIYDAKRIAAVEEARKRIREFIQLNESAILRKKLDKRINEFIRDVSWETGLEVDLVGKLWKAIEDKYYEDKTSSTISEPVKAST